jgi:hypothetical protein
MRLQLEKYMCIYALKNYINVVSECKIIYEVTQSAHEVADDHSLESRIRSSFRQRFVSG